MRRTRRIVTAAGSAFLVLALGLSGTAARTGYPTMVLLAGRSEGPGPGRGRICQQPAPGHHPQGNEGAGVAGLAIAQLGTQAQTENEVANEAEKGSDP